MTQADLDDALAKLVQCRNKLTEDEVALLGRGWKTLVRGQHEAVRRQVEKRVPEQAVEDVEAHVFADLYEALLDGFPESGSRTGIATTRTTRRPGSSRRLLERVGARARSGGG
jgi:hypothetical protein